MSVEFLNVVIGVKKEKFPYVFQKKWQACKPGSVFSVFTGNLYHLSCPVIADGILQPTPPDTPS